MAIQISGTTVVNNSRQLQNIASVDATTAATIAANAGGGGATSVHYGQSTSNIPFGFISSHTRFTKDLEAGGIIFATGSPSTVTIFHRPNGSANASGQVALASATGAIA